MRLALLVTILAAGGSGHLPAATAELELARAGRALVPVVVSADASDDLRTTAAELARYLGQITGATFPVEEGDGHAGLALGRAASFPALKVDDLLAGEGLTADERYLLRTHDRGAWLLGRTDVAARHAAWDFLDRLGYRHFFPGQRWEIVPRRPSLKIALDTVEEPDYAVRRIWYGYGLWDYNEAPYQHWRRHNRAEGTFELNTGHAYDGILSRYRQEFAAHPEWLGLLDGQRKSSKFCVANAGLRKLIVRYAEEYFAAHPEERTVSIEPSDGGGWCACEACAQLGPPSDRALTLANEISTVLEERYPGKYVALYAYAQHSPPPSIAARPRVIVSVATGFIRGGLSVDEVIAGWKNQGVRQFGIREYYGVNVWDRDLPGAGRGGRLGYLAETIPRFHAQGARFMSAESSDNWGPNGLGYYVANRLLWDVEEAGHIDEHVADFLDKCFGPAPAPMARYYALLTAAEPPLMSRDLLGRMYRALDEAHKLADDPAIAARLDDLTLYTRYVELFRTYDNAKDEARQAAFEQLLRHAYRMRSTMMVHVKALCRDLPARDKRVKLPPEAAFNVPEGKNPWKSSTPWQAEELTRMIADGIQRNPLLGVEPVEFGDKLVPADPALAADVPRLDDTTQGRGEQFFWTWFDGAPGRLELTVTGGLIAHYRDRGNARLDLFHVSDGQHTLVAHAETPPDGQPRVLVLESPHAGLHQLVVNDGHDLTRVEWPAGQRRTIPLDRQHASEASGRRSGYFFVPAGTRVIAGHAAPDARATLRDGQGRVVWSFSSLDGPDFFRCDVPAGEDGRLWSFHHVPGRLILLNVPPLAARHPSELLLP